MNNKIFKKKSSLYLALTFLLLLICVGIFFIFNALAANVPEGKVQIKSSLTAAKGIIVERVNDDNTCDPINSTSSVTVSKNQTVKLKVSFSEDYVGDVNKFVATDANDEKLTDGEIKGKYYSKTNNVNGDDYDCSITKDSDNDNTFTLDLTDWTTSIFKYYAIVDVNFKTEDPNVKEMKKVTFKSIKSDYGWIEPEKMFEIYEEKNGTYEKKKINDFFKVLEDRSELTFYVKLIDNNFKDCFENINFSVTHDAGNNVSLDYDLDKKEMITTESGELFQKVVLKFFNFGNRFPYEITDIASKIWKFQDKVSGTTYSRNGDDKKFTDEKKNSYNFGFDVNGTFTGKDNVLFKYVVDDDGNRYFEDFRKIGNEYKLEDGDNPYKYKFTDTKAGVTYNYDGDNKQFTDNDKNTYKFSSFQGGESFYGKDGVMFRYNIVTNAFEDNRYETVGIKKDLNLNLTLSNVTCYEKRKITVNKATDNFKNDVDLTSSNNVDVKIAVPATPLGSNEPQYNDNFVLVETDDKKCYRIADKSKRSYELIKCEDSTYDGVKYKYTEEVFGDQNGNIYAYDGKSFTVATTTYTYDKDNKQFKDQNGNKYAYDETKKSFTVATTTYTYDKDNKQFKDQNGNTYAYDGKSFMVATTYYTYDGTNKQFTDQDGNTYAYDEATKSFTGKDVVYTYYSQIYKRFIDSKGNVYDYNETTKSFTNKDGLEFVYENNKLSLRQKSGAYEDISVPYNGSVYIKVTPATEGWYNGSTLTVKDADTSEDYAKEFGYYVVSSVTGDKKLTISEFTLQNMSFSINFDGAIAGIDERVKISVSKIIKDEKENETLEEVNGTNGKYSGITPNGFVCEIEAASVDVNIDGLKKKFSDGVKVGEEAGTGKNKLPCKKFTVKGLDAKKGLTNDVVLSITDVPYKTIDVSFYEPSENNSSMPGNKIDNNDEDRKADIYLSGSTAEVTSFSSGQEWNFDFNFTEGYESSLKEGIVYTYDETNKQFIDENGNKYAYDGKSFTGANNVVYTYDGTNKQFTDQDGNKYAYDGKSFTGKDKPTLKASMYAVKQTECEIYEENGVKKFKGKDGVVYEYDETKKSFTGKNGEKYFYREDKVKKFIDQNENKYVYDEAKKTFTGAGGAVYTYDENSKKFKDKYGNEYNFGSTFTGKDGVVYAYDEANNQFKDKDGNTYSCKSVLTDKNGIVYTYDETNKQFTDTDGNTYDYDEINKSFTGKDSVFYTYDEANKQFKGTNGTTYDYNFTFTVVKTYTYDETNKQFTDQYGNKYAYDGNSFTGADDVVYTYDEATKQFIDQYGNKYAYDETNKSFTGKIEIVYTYNRTNKQFTGTDGKTYSYDETKKFFTDTNNGVTYNYTESTVEKFIYELLNGPIKDEKDKEFSEITVKSNDGKTFNGFKVPSGIRGYSKIAIIIKPITEKKLPVQFKVSSNMATPRTEGNETKYTLNDFKISYIKKYKKNEGNDSPYSYVPAIKPTDGIYPYNNDNENWADLNSSDWQAISGDANNDIFSSSIEGVVPYKGILVFRITLNNNTSKLKYILNGNSLISANGLVEIKVVSPTDEDSNAPKKDKYSCIQVVVKGSQNGGIRESMTGKSNSIAIGEFESSIKKATFKFSDSTGAEYDLENSANKAHAGNILEKMSVYKIDSEYFNSVTENELYDSNLLYECQRNDDGIVENTKNSYMLNHKKTDNTIAIRAQQGIDVKNAKYYFKLGDINEEITGEENVRIVDLGEDNNGYIIVVKIPDKLIKVNASGGAQIEIQGIDIVKYNISLEDFGDIGIERRLSSETEFKELGADEREFTVDFGEDFEIRIKGEAKHSSEGLFNRITLRKGALFLKEGTQSGGTALEKNSDGSFKYTFFVYRVRGDSVIAFSNVINKVILDFDNVDGMEFYECSNSTDADNNNNNIVTVLEDKKIQGKISCEYGYKYSFAVKAATGYDLESFKLKATVEGSEAIEEEEGSNEFKNMFDCGKDGDYKIYTIVNKDKNENKNGVQKSTVISGSISKETKTVTFATPQRPKEDTSVEPILSYLNEQGDEISSVNADYGSNVSFSIKLGDKYSNSSITVDLYENKNNKKGEHIETLHMVSGYYKIMNITNNYIVEVSGHSVNSYFVNFSKNDYVDYSLITDGEESAMSDNVSVLYGGSCYFKVKEKEGYQMGENSVVQATSASGQKITLEKNSLGQYKLTNIKDNYTITVENIDEIFYSLKFITTEGVTYYNEVGSVITGDFKVSYGKNFEFSIKIDDAHSESIQGAYIVTNESGQSEVKIQKLASDRYLIQNVTQDITIRVANVNKNKYTITLTKDEGIDYYNKNGKVITGENEVEYGGDLSFKVNLYPLYANSNIKVMLGNQELSADDNEFYTVETVTENKTVTVVGIGKTAVADVIETISSLPTDISDDTELEQIIQAVRDYNNLSDSEKSNVGNYYILEQLQKKVADVIHTYNGVTAEGLDWNIKLIANPIDTDIDACTRIYGKLNSEYILSLYDVYLWDTLTDRRYTLPEGKSVVIHLPTPNMTYFENASGIHENSDGKLNFLSLNMGNSVTSLETSSLSPIGIIADRSIQPGRSSLIDAIDSNVSMLTNYTLGNIGGSGNKKESNFSGSKNNSSNTFDEGEPLTGGSGSETNKFRKTDNSTTRLGSALKLILIIMILLILIAAIWALVKKYKDKSKKRKE